MYLCLFCFSYYICDSKLEGSIKKFINAIRSPKKKLETPALNIPKSMNKFKCLVMFVEKQETNFKVAVIIHFFSRVCSSLDVMNFRFTCCASCWRDGVCVKSVVVKITSIFSGIIQYMPLNILWGRISGFSFAKNKITLVL